MGSPQAQRAGSPVSSTSTWYDSEQAQQTFRAMGVVLGESPVAEGEAPSWTAACRRQSPVQVVSTPPRGGSPLSPGAPRGASRDVVAESPPGSSRIHERGREFLRGKQHKVRDRAGKG